MLLILIILLLLLFALLAEHYGDCYIQVDSVGEIHGIGRRRRRRKVHTKVFVGTLEGKRHVVSKTWAHMGR
jgi:hypothetical protein